MADSTATLPSIVARRCWQALQPVSDLRIDAPDSRRSMGDAVRRRGIDPLVVQPDEAGGSTNSVRRAPGCSRRAARTRRRGRRVRVNGRPGARATRSGAATSSRSTDRRPARAARSNRSCDLTVLYADEALIAVDKPAGMPAVALRAGDRGTVANVLLGRYPELRAVGGTRFEAGLVHRLDTPHFRRPARGPHRRGLASVRAAVPAPARSASSTWRGGRTASRPRRRHRRADRTSSAATARRCAPAPSRSAPRRCGARPALTALSAAAPARRARRCWRCASPTGVRHQIRVHLASIGHPVIGDAALRRGGDGQAAPRLLLHASAPLHRAIRLAAGGCVFAARCRKISRRLAATWPHRIAERVKGRRAQPLRPRPACPCRPCPSLRARATQVLRVVRVFDQPVVHVVADLLALDADEVDALDRLVDALAVEDAALQLLDADAEQRLRTAA